MNAKTGVFFHFKQALHLHPPVYANEIYAFNATIYERRVQEIEYTAWAS
jgi:hypothetical protein